MKKITRSFVFVLVILLSACQFSFGFPALGSSPTAIPTTYTQYPIVTGGEIPAGDLRAIETTLTNLYQQVSPGVVAILTSDSQGGGLGSGFVYDTQGHIITNYHVVEGATALEVDFPSGLKTRATVVGTDIDSDIAVIKVDVPVEELHPLTLGDSEQVLVGQVVVAIGNPFGLTNTMTWGIVSAKERMLDSFRTSSTGGNFSAGDIIQTDTAINPGNSGGPLLNLNGEVIGINRAIQSTSSTASGEPVNSGIGFAISINIVKRVVPSLISTGTYDYPFLGISCMTEISLDAQEALGLSRSTGAYVTSVTPNGPAAQAGLQGGSMDSSMSMPRGGDLIIAADGHPVMIYADLISYLMTNKSPGEQVTLTILRDNIEKEVVITLGKRP
jgi:S1-C subfamily serine protease